MGFPLVVRMTDVPDAAAVHGAITRARAHLDAFAHAVFGCEVVVWAERRPITEPSFGVQIYLSISEWAASDPAAARWPAPRRDLFVNRSPAQEGAEACVDAAFLAMHAELEAWWRKARGPRAARAGAEDDRSV